MLDAHNDALSRSSSGSGWWCAAAAEAGDLEDRLRKRSLVHKILFSKHFSFFGHRKLLRFHYWFIVLKHLCRSLFAFCVNEWSSPSFAVNPRTASSYNGFAAS